MKEQGTRGTWTAVWGALGEQWCRVGTVHAREQRIIVGYSEYGVVKVLGSLDGRRVRKTRAPGKGVKIGDGCETRADLGLVSSEVHAFFALEGNALGTLQTIPNE